MKIGNLLEARENASDQVIIGFGFASDWLREWREFSRPITERNEAKPKQSWIILGTRLKIAPCLDSGDDFRSGCRHVNRCHRKQSFLGPLA